MVKNKSEVPGEMLVQRVALESGDELVLTLRRLNFVEKAEATALLQADAGATPRIVQYAQAVGAAIDSAALASGAALESVGLAADWQTASGQFWAAFDAGTVVDLFLALLAHGRLTALEKKESSTSPSG